MPPLLLAAALAAATPAAPAYPPIPTAQLDDTLTITGAEVRARARDSRLSVPVAVNGQGPYRFVVDSGADRSVIGSALAAELALPAGRLVRLNSMAGATTVATVVLDRVTVGDSTVIAINAPALEERHLGAQGLIGIDALADQRLMLDFERARITVQPASVPERARREGEDIVVTARRRGGQLIITQVRVGGVSAMAVIDTGAEMTIGNEALAQRLGRRLKPLGVTELTTVTGATMQARLGILPEIQIASLTLGNVPIAFVTTPTFALFGLADRPAILLGTDLLEAFRRVSLDFRRRKVRFTLRASSIAAGRRSATFTVTGPAA